MRHVFFPYIEDENGSMVYPDDKALFKKTRPKTIEGVKYVVADYYGVDSSLLNYVEPTPPEPEYTKQDFLDEMKVIADKIFK